MKTMKVAMIGVGCISGIYLDNITKVFKDIELLGVCDLVRERAEKAQKDYNVPKLYETMHDAFNDPEVDIVLNLTRPYEHFEVTKAALLKGKHVYSEKPLGASLEEGKALVALAEEKGLYLGGAPDTFLGAGIQTCRRLIDDGFIGTPVGSACFMICRGHESWHPDPDFYYQRGGGPLYDTGPYYITALINLLGGVSKVYGYAHTSYDTRLITAEPHVGEIIKVNTPTHIESFLTMDCGITVSLLTSFDIYKTQQNRFEIYGTKGTLFVPDPNYFGGEEEIVFFNGETKTEERYPLVFDYKENSRCLGVDDTAVAIETGRAGRATSRQTFHVLEVMAGVLESAKSGKPYILSSHFEKEAPMDPTLEHGKL